MKKIIAAGIVAIAFTACADQKNADNTVVNTDSSTVTTTTEAVAASPTTMAPVTYTPTEGDVSYRSGKVVVYRGSAWVNADNDITLDSGITVKRNGQVVRNGETVQLEEGESVSRVGKWFNKAGEGVEDGWSATKKGVRKAAEAVKKAGQKTGEAVKDAVD